MTKKRKESTAVEKDCISDLPDEILHKILWYIKSPIHTARTCTLSTRWRSVWRSYAMVEFDVNKCRYQNDAGGLASFENFVEAEIGRFCRYNQFPIQTLDVTVPGLRRKPFRYPVLERLLELASERKAALVDVMVRIFSGSIFLPYRLLSNPGVENLSLTNITFDPDSKTDFPLSLGSLRSLCLDRVCHVDDEHFTRLIASCPLLETLKMSSVFGLWKLKISNATNLKWLEIDDSYPNKEIEIEAPELQSLLIGDAESLIKLDLIAPQLTSLEICYTLLPTEVLQVVISKLPSLKSLALKLVDANAGKMLKLSSPTLEVFKLHTWYPLNIVLDACPSLSRFFLIPKADFPCDIQKCETSNAVACQWHLDIILVKFEDEDDQLLHLDEIRSGIARFPKFQAVHISFLRRKVHKVAFDEEELNDHTTRPPNINHLNLETEFSLKSAPKDILKAMFWICRPKFFTVVYQALTPERFFGTLLDMMAQYSSGEQGVDESGTWQDQLKDVKMITRNVDKIIEGEEEVKEEELMDISKDMAASLATKKRVCFLLTWH
ncbi:F-box protein At5g03100 [Linum grandiflorum]